MGKKPPQSKRKRDASPENSSKTRNKRQRSITTYVKDDGGRNWMKYVPESGEITQDIARGACGFGLLGSKQSCPNKFASKKRSTPEKSVAKENGIIVLSDSEDESDNTCSKGKCKANPYCLNYLGQDKWEEPAQLRKVPLDHCNEKFKGDPHRFLRKAGIPVGLRNLGATCYANAALQVWNQDLAFRSGVFQCVPSVKDSESLEKTPIYQLQVTFAALSYGLMKVFNPRPLVDSLRLNSGEQQDAQEFSKLFLSLLATEFAKQESPALRNLVADQFEGSLIYGTQCHGCNHKSEQITQFLELEISLKTRSTLSDCLDETFESEVLSGDNKYRCSKCNTLQDATRYSRVKKLPPVLHLSVQRFVFDFESLTRKKTKNTIQYPMQLDMGRWVGEEGRAESTSKELYELRGVLLHKGASAYHGHYEAQVFDIKEQKWYQFNDELVTEIKHFKPEEDKNLSSKECYCLIYGRSDTDTPVVHAPSASVMSQVEDLNNEIKQNCDDYNQTKTEIEESLQTMQQTKSTVYQMWQLQSTDDQLKIVPKEALERYLSIDLPKLPEKVVPEVTSEGDVTMKDEFAQSDQNFRHLLCEHGNFSPERVSDIKLITPSAYRLIVEQDPGLLPEEDSYQEICTSCIRSRYDEHCYFENHRAVLSELASAMDEDDPMDSLGSKCWISKSWFRDWKLQKPKMHRFGLPDPSPDDESYRGDVYCAHDGLAHETASRVAIPYAAATIIRSIFPDWQILEEYAEPCAVCDVLLEDLESQKEELLKKADTEKTRLRNMLVVNPLTSDKRLDPGTDYAVIVSSWIRSWRCWVTRPNEFIRPDPPDNSSFLCTHSLLSFDPHKKQDLADPRFSIVKLFNWDDIAYFYPNSGPHIGLRLDSDTQEVVCTVKTCEECRTARTQFGSSSIVVQVLRKTDSEPTLESYNAAKETVSSQVDLFSSNGEGSRRSRRVKGEGGSRRFVPITITPSTTVKDIKAEIENKENIFAFYQSLYYNGEELRAPEATVKDLGIEINDLIQLKPLVDEFADTLLDEDSDIELIDFVDAKEKKARPVEGRAFQGTMLASA